MIIVVCVRAHVEAASHVADTSTDDGVLRVEEPSAAAVGNASKVDCLLPTHMHDRITCSQACRDHSDGVVLVHESNNVKIVVFGGFDQTCPQRPSNTWRSESVEVHLAFNTMSHTHRAVGSAPWRVGTQHSQQLRRW